MSRLPSESNCEPLDYEENESYIAFVSNYAVPKAFSRTEIKSETDKDEYLIELRNILSDCSSENSEINKRVHILFDKVMQELSVTSDGIVLRGSRIVLPCSLQSKAVKIAHEGHQGSSKTKSLLRTKVWFNRFDSQVDEVVANCPYCQLNDAYTAQPVQMTELPVRV